MGALVSRFFFFYLFRHRPNRSRMAIWHYGRACGFRVGHRIAAIINCFLNLYPISQLALSNLGVYSAERLETLPFQNKEKKIKT